MINTRSQLNLRAYLITVTSFGHVTGIEPNNTVFVLLGAKNFKNDIYSTVTQSRECVSSRMIGRFKNQLKNDWSDPASDSDSDYSAAEIQGFSAQQEVPRTSRKV